MNTAQTSDYLKLHFIVFLWGSTAIMGKLISIPAVEMIFYRMLLASLGMVVLMLIKKESFLVPTKDILKLLAVGILVSTHWIAFFGAGQASTASVSLVGFATASLWTAIIEPLSNRKSIQPLEIGLGVFVIIGLYIIFSFDFEYFLGLGLGILSGLLLAIFAVINSHLVRRIPSVTITMYEMLGGFLFTAAFLPFYQDLWAIDGELQLSPTAMDWLYISILAIVCSVYAYSLSVELMKKISVFTIQLALNLEPVYGIIMAVILLNEGKYLNTAFYIGTGIILLAVLLYPYLKNRFAKSNFA
jgi:drug/metabolite transporter (DMT)-like permease